MPNTEQIRSICDNLVFRFVPRPEVAARKADYYRRLMQDDDVEVFDPDDTGSMRRLLAKIVREELEKRGAEKVSIGVSSGLDSRGCLGAVLDVLDPRQVFAHTYGHKGNRDFENLPRLVASRVVNHVLHNKIATGVKIGGPRGIGIRFKTETIVYSGVSDGQRKPEVSGRLGDLMGGSAIRDTPVGNWDEARRSLALHSSKLQTSMVEFYRAEGILPAGYDPAASLPDEPLLRPELVSLEDQVNLLFRQHQFVLLKPGGIDELNLPLAGTWNSVAEANAFAIMPYTDPRWQKSFLRLPADMRRDKALYKAFLVAEYPELFPDMVNPDTFEMIAANGPTAMSWKKMLRENSDFRESVATLVESLNSRGGWFNLPRLQELVQSGDRLAGYALQRLCETEGSIASGRIAAFA